MSVGSAWCRRWLAPVLRIRLRLEASGAWNSTRWANHSTTPINPIPIAVTTRSARSGRSDQAGRGRGEHNPSERDGCGADE